MASFDPRPRVGGDSAAPARRFQPCRFDPRPRVGGDPSSGTPIRWADSFDPRPRVGGDGIERLTGGVHIVVSIHAPVWGATTTRYTCERNARVSIHAPVWGATLRLGAIPPLRSQFRSTPPCGGRHCSVPNLNRLIVVSIHAPVWGATPSSTLIISPVSCFDPRPRVGGDPPPAGCVVGHYKFRSTPPCGGRPPLLITITKPYTVSIHAPVWGATLSLGAYLTP